MESPISLMIDLPEALHEALRSYLDSHAELDQDSAIAAAIALFLAQNSNNGNALFGKVAA